MFLLIFLSLIIIILTSLYLWGLKCSKYWSNQNIVHYIPSIPFFGNFKNIFMFKMCAADQFSLYYNKKEFQNESIIGINIFHKPALLIRDPDLIKRILVKDFNYFSNRHASSDPHTDALGGYNLFLIRNPMWKQLRIKLTPIFTSGKMRQMFHLIKSVGDDLNQFLLSESNVDTDKKDITNNGIEIKEISARYATDVIASCAFGVQANCIKDPESEFRSAGRRMFKFTFYRSFEFSSIFFLPEIVSIFRFKAFSEETNQFIRSTINHVMSEREESGVPRNDLIDALIDLKRESKISATKPMAKENIIFKDDVLVAQAAIFFSAGFETSSSTITFALYELAKQPKLQERLREEIKTFVQKTNGDLTYEDLIEMEYLGMVINETLRLYPTLPILDRLCEPPDYTENGYSLDPIIDYRIPRGMPVIIPIHSIQRDSKYFENPNDFDPERFSSVNKHKIHPYTYMPFGIGPHTCIGERFGLMSTKFGVVSILRNHFVKPSAKTPTSMNFEKKALFLQSDELINLNIVYNPLIY